MMIESLQDNDFNIVLVSWNNNYYIAQYKTFMIDPSLVKIISKKIDFDMFQKYCYQYPVIKISNDILFDAGNEVEHILKMKNAELVRLDSEETKKIYQSFTNHKILFDIRHQCVIQ